MFWVEGSPGANLYVQGDEAGLTALLEQVSAPRYAFLLFPQQAEALVREHFLLRALQLLIRMQVSSTSFRPAEPHPNASPGISGPVRLTGGDIVAVNALYRTDSGARITRDYLNGGVYYGMWNGTQLVSVAGTQLFRPNHGIAVVANVLTHPRHRGHGHATQCVSAVVSTLLETVPDVVLNVDPGNTPAVHSYRRLGFTDVGEIGEAWAFWRGRNIFDRLGAQLMYWLMG
jgi:ribosomal protein S18 acetylase RimI-like enzyme